jgi:hypothetical protein
MFNKHLLWFMHSTILHQRYNFMRQGRSPYDSSGGGGGRRDPSISESLLMR